MIKASEKSEISIIGHEKQWLFLKRAAESNKLPHALLFSGEEKLGKKFLAVQFSKFLNCKAKERPCEQCESCFYIQKKAHPDVYFIENEHQSEIKILEIRKLIEKFSLKPGLSDFKIGIIDNAHFMTEEAQNCFLKLLEEPKGKAMLILISDYPELLLATILSRTARIKFSEVSREKINKFLIEKDKKRAENIANLCFGRPGLAIDLLFNPEKEQARRTAITDIEKTRKANLQVRFQYAKKIPKEEISEILDVWIDYFRSKLVCCSGFSLELKAIKENLELVRFFRSLIMQTNINKKLALENLLINIS